MALAIGLLAILALVFAISKGRGSRQDPIALPSDVNLQSRSGDGPKPSGTPGGTVPSELNVEKPTPSVPPKERQFLRGTVMDPDGAPLVGARVVLGSGAESVSMAEGEFEIECESGEGEGVVSLEGYLTSFIRGVPNGPPLRVVLSRTEVVEGVVRLADGTGVPGVSVSDSGSGAHCTTNSAGEFALNVIAGMAPDVKCSGHAAVKLEWVSKTHVEVTVMGAALRVLVTDEAGHGVPGALVEYRFEASGKPVGGGILHVASNGWGTLLVPAGATVRISASGPPLVASTEDRRLEPEGRLEEWRIALRRSGGQGTIVLGFAESEGPPVKAVAIEVRDDAGQPIGDLVESVREVTAEGRVSLQGIPSGRVRLSVKDRTAQDWKARFRIPLELVVDVLPGAEVTRDCQFTLGGRCTVSFSDAEGTLLVPESVDVVATGGVVKVAEFAYQGEDGQWVDTPDKPTMAWIVEPLAAGTYLVRCWQWNAERSRVVPSGSRRVSIVAGKLVAVAVTCGVLEE